MIELCGFAVAFIFFLLCVCIFVCVSSRIALYWNKHFQFILLIKHFCLNFVYLKFSDYFLAEKLIFLIFFSEIQLIFSK